MDRQHLQRQISWSEIKEKNISAGRGGGGAANQREEALNAMGAFMEMKHLGSTLRPTAYVPGPQVPGLTEQRAP